MDITTDGFGFMLAVGDLAWVPFVYSLQPRFLVFRQKELGLAATAAIFAVNGLGYWIFRSANGQKNDFRNGHNPKSASPSALVCLLLADRRTRRRLEVPDNGARHEAAH